MTSKSDFHHLGEMGITVGELMRDRGEMARDIASGWARGGTAGDPMAATRGGGGSEAEQEDRRREAKDAAAAALLQEKLHRAESAYERAVRDLHQIYAVIMPASTVEARNRRTGELDPITPADVATAGWCRSCWRNEQQMVKVETNASSVRYYRDYCRWCGGFKADHGIEPPVELLRLRHAGRRITVADVEEAVAAAKKQGKAKRGKAA